MVIRIAFAELLIIIALLMYILQLKSVISPLQTWSLAGIFGAIAAIVLSIVEKKYRNDV
jgi:hypothetical protein